MTVTNVSSSRIISILNASNQQRSNEKCTCMLQWNWDALNRSAEHIRNVEVHIHAQCATFPRLSRPVWSHWYRVTQWPDDYRKIQWRCAWSDGRGRSEEGLVKKEYMWSLLTKSGGVWYFERKLAISWWIVITITTKGVRFSQFFISSAHASGASQMPSRL